MTTKPIPRRTSLRASACARLILAAASAATCGAAFADGSPAATPAAKAKAGTRSADASAGTAKRWVVAEAGKHNGSGIRLGYRVGAGVQPGQPASVELQFSGVTDTDARAEWRAPAGGSVVDARTGAGGAASSVMLVPGRTTTVELQVTAMADGMAYLDVFTTQGGRSSAQQVPIKVGSGTVALKREGTPATTPSGEKVISLPSQPR